MEESVKNRIIVIIIILNIIFLLLWVEAGMSLGRYKKAVNTKAALTMELEEKNAKLEKEKSELSRELEKAVIRLSDEKSSLEDTRKELSQEQLAEQALKVELEKVARLKETLEKDLKEALTTIDALNARPKPQL